MARLEAGGQVPARQIAVMTDVLAQSSALNVTLADMIGVRRPDHRRTCTVEEALAR